MSIRVSAYTITIGDEQRLEIAQGEDREFRLTFNDPNTGSERDMTSPNSVVMTVKNRDNGIQLFARSYSGFQGNGSAGTPRFQVLATDTATAGEGTYDVIVEWTDSSGYLEQLLVASSFEIVRGGLATGITSPPAVQVTYGLNWWPSGYPGLWSAISGGYRQNDAMQAYDGSLGATAVSTFRAVVNGVTHYPMTGTSPTLATGWAYVGQHGAFPAISNGSTLVASGTNITISPSGAFVYAVVGTGSIQTINAATGQPLYLAPGQMFTTATGGNLAYASTGIGGRLMTLIWGGSLWWQSY